MFTLYKRSRKM